MNHHMNESILLEILANISRLFKESENEPARVTAFKNTLERDIVTTLDLRIHNAVKDILKQNNLSIYLHSEEGEDFEANNINSNEETILLDPLDGSLNYAIGLDFYCSQLAHIKDGIIEHSGICIPSQNQMLSLSLSDCSFISSRKILEKNNDILGATYLAYGSQESEEDRKLKKSVLNVIDMYGNGVFRLGSAGYGVYLTIIGKLKGFIGINIKVYDVIPLFSIARYMKFKIAYSITNNCIDVLITRDETLLSYSKEIFNKSYRNLTFFELDKPLEIRSE